MTRETYSTLVGWLIDAGDFAARDITVDEIATQHGRRADALARHARVPQLRVLELGAGGGYTAAALAHRGHDVVAVEWVTAAAEQARWWASQSQRGSLRVVEGDFYEIALDERFDVVCYFDGFGIGSDADQRRLLRRVAGWLEPSGCALIDVMSPTYWSRRNGTTDHYGNLNGQFDFDAEASTLRFRQWRSGKEAITVTQVVRCYTPADLRLLLEGTGLALESFEPFESEQYARAVPIEEAMLYLARLVPVG